MSTEISSSPRLATALEWAAKGYRVFPTQVNSKQPPRGFRWREEATTDPATIGRWWAEEDYNVATALEGEQSVADTDGMEAEASWDTFGRPETFTIRTPRGGYHYHLVGRLPNTASKFGPGLDTRGEGGYVLLPGSVIDGKEYVVVWDAPPAPVPEPLAALAMGSKRADAGKPQVPKANGHYDEALALIKAREWLAKQEVPQAGARDTATYALMAKLRDFGLCAEDRAKLIEATGNEIHPLDLMRINDSLERGNAQNPAGIEAPIPGAALFPAPTDYTTQEEKSYNASWFTPEAEMDKTPTTKWIIPKVLPEGGTAVIVGETGSFKSFLAQMLALGIASGVDTWGQPVDAGVTIYAALEGLSGVKGDRRRAWKLHHGVEAVPNFYAGPAPIMSDAAACQAFRAEAAKLKPRLIVIETVSKLMAGLNEDKASDMVMVTAFMDKLVEECGATVIAIHHKSDKTGAADIRGSSALKAGVDTVLEVSRQGKGMVAIVTSTKQKDDADGQSWAFRGRIAGPSLVFEACDIPAVCGDDRRHLVRAVLEVVSWVETQALAEELEKRDPHTDWAKVLRDATNDKRRNSPDWKNLYERKGGTVFWRIKDEGALASAPGGFTEP